MIIIIIIIIMRKIIIIVIISIVNKFHFTTIFEFSEMRFFWIKESIFR